MFWTDMWKAGVSFWSTGVALQETALAACAVVGHRGRTIDAALRNPLEADLVELGMMVPEKVAAFGLAGASLARDWIALQSELLAQGRDLAALASGRAGGDTARRVGERASRIAARTGAAAERALAPVHAAATANQRRLGKGRARKG